MYKQGTGGLQGHAENLAKHLKRQGHDVKVMTRAYSCVPENLGFLTFRESQLDAEVGGIPVRAVNYSFKIVRWAKLIAKLREYPILWRLGVNLFRILARSSYKEFEGFDLIHYVGQSDQLFGFAAADAAAYYGIPFIVQPTCHPFVVGDSSMDCSLYRKAAMAMVHTRYEAAHLAPMLSGVAIDVVGNGIENRSDGNGEHFRDKYNIHGPMLLYIGRRDTDKGYGLVTEAFLNLRKSRDDVTLVCMGPSGGLAKVDEPGIVHFDYADEQTKHDALAACTCLCVPSEGESFGLVYMEAGRYSKPVVARRLPVLEELLQNGRAGLLVGELVANKNIVHLTPENLAASLDQLISSLDLCKEIGQQCHLVSDQFTWDKVVINFESSYYAAMQVNAK
jgi:glycosyltransferase involved in cell wall biosynthesis